ncbi:MAG: hydrogenase maturation protease [Planctomycetota bacterium]|nr:hydrogenase maturation protease [Planctomycetota bacterium]
MPASQARILLLGYGNPGRRDDGLGPAFADTIARRGIEGVTVETDYQLQVEDAPLIAEHDVVVFADATVQGPGPFTLTPVEARGEISFTTHSVSQGALLALARDHFQSKAEGWALAIHGQDFDGFGEGLSATAQANLAAALEFLTPRLEQHRIHDGA